MAYLLDQDRQRLQKFLGQNDWPWEPILEESAGQVARSWAARAGCVVACKPLLLALHLCRHSTYCSPDIPTQPARPHCGMACWTVIGLLGPDIPTQPARLIAVSVKSGLIGQLLEEQLRRQTQEYICGSSDGSRAVNKPPDSTTGKNVTACHH